MADYYSQTVIQQPIPITDMTALERLVLQEMFQSDVIDDTLYFSHDEGPRDLIWPMRSDVEAALKANPMRRPKNKDILIALVENAMLKPPNDDGSVELDISGISWERILQPIIERSTTLSYLTIVTSWTCSKMRPDGFGGMAIMVTATKIKCNSTAGILEKWIGAFEHAESTKSAKRKTKLRGAP